MSKATIHVQVEPSVREALDEFAKTQRWTLAVTVEVLIREALDARRENGLSARG